MPSILLQPAAGPWVSSDASLTTSTVPGPAQGVPASRFLADGAAPGVEATTALAAPVDLTACDELRFWARTDRPANGSDSRPFVAELGYDDAGDAPADDHHWLVPLARSGVWEHHRIGLGGERRSAVTRMRVRLLTPLPLRLEVAEVLAAADAPTADVETALVDRLAATIVHRGPRSSTVSQAIGGATSVVVGLAPFRAGNEVAVTDVSAGPAATPTRHRVTQVTHDAVLSRTTLTFDPARPVIGTLPAGSAVAVVAPVVVETPTSTGAPPPDPPDPCVAVSLSDAREDLARGWSVAQRDSFRRRGAGVVCGVRPAPRPLLLEFQVLVLSSERSVALALRDDIQSDLGTQVPLRVGGVELPVATVPAPVRSERDRVVLAPLVVQVGTRQEAGPRVELAWVRAGRIVVAPLDRPSDAEAIGVLP